MTDSSPLPRPRPPVDGPFVSLAAGARFTCGLTRPGSVYCWGSGVPLARGDGDGCDGCARTPARVAELPPMRYLAADTHHACALTASGEAWCWGFNAEGSLGNGRRGNSLLEAPGPVVGGLTFATIEPGGEDHTCALTLEGAAYCWGFNRFGQLGYGGPGGASATQLVPVRVASDPMVSIGAGLHYSCGVGLDGGASCWGYELYGLVASGRCEPAFNAGCSYVPEPIPGRTRFRSLVSGQRHSCGLTTAGAAYCWGTNTDGELGLGFSETLVGVQVPRPVLGGLAFRALAAARSFSCGLVEDGRLYCWGGNFWGRFGDGSMTPSNVPVPAAGGMRFASIALGSEHACGVTPDGIAFCWGGNEWGQLGHGLQGPDVLAVGLAPMRVAGQ